MGRGLTVEQAVRTCVSTVGGGLGVRLQFLVEPLCLRFRPILVGYLLRACAVMTAPVTDVRLLRCRRRGVLSVFLILPSAARSILLFYG